MERLFLALLIIRLGFHVTCSFPFNHPSAVCRFHAINSPWFEMVFHNQVVI